MKVIFDGLQRVTHVLGVFRSPHEIVDYPDDRAAEAIRLGYARPLHDAAMHAPVKTTAITAPVRKDVEQPAPPKPVSLWVVTPTKGGRSTDLDRVLASLALESPAHTTLTVITDFPGPVEMETEGVLSWWAKRVAGGAMPTLKVFRTGGGKGPNVARDLSIRQAPDDAVIVEVDDHDVPEPFALRVIADEFKDDSVQAVYANHFVVDRLDRLIRLEALEDYHPHAFEEFCPARGLRAFRKSLYLGVGGYRASEFPSGDHWLWLRFAEYLSERPDAIAHIGMALSRFKMCENSISVTLAQEQAKSSDAAVLAAITGVILPKRQPMAVEPDPADYSHVSVTMTGSPKPHLDTVIVIPCYRSKTHVVELLNSMREAECAATVIVVNGDGPYEASGIAQIALSKNTGFGHGCNVGAHAARKAGAKYVCFLNADTHVGGEWLVAMANELKAANDIGIIGNRQVDGHGKIHSCGSVWDWKTRHFEHLLRGQEPSNHPDWTRARDVDAITASCILMPLDVFNKVGGFDERYRIGYWEDSDLCMKVRNAGYRIRFTPDSQIVHYGGHSGLVHHPFYAQNAELCRKRWIETGLVDKFAIERGERPHGRVVACYIALNEAEYIAASIESVYPLVDKVIIVEGGNDYAVAAGLCGPDKRSTDGTLEAIKGVADPQGKIEIISGAWKDKAEQRNAYASKLKDGDWMLLMDGDEVFYEAGLWRLSRLMHDHDCIMPAHDVFWNNFRTVGTGAWEKYPQVKVVKWRDGWRYRDHNCPCDANGKTIGQILTPYRTVERLYAHYAWVKPIEKLRAKAAYYERQPGARERIRPNYMDTVFLPWRKDPQGIEGSLGTHPFGGGGARKFAGGHPGPIARRIRAGAYPWAMEAHVK